MLCNRLHSLVSPLLLLLLLQVSDIAIAVREGADAVMLSGETAYGRFPMKALSVQSQVALRTEAAMTRYQVGRGEPGSRVQ
jgi:pyruvate kinase